MAMGETETRIRDEFGRFTPAAKGIGKPITSENAAALARKRWEKHKLAAVRRIVKEAQSIDANASTSAEAYGLLMAKQYTALLDSDKPRMDDVEKFAQLIGAAPRAADLRQDDDKREEMGDIIRQLAQFAAQIADDVRKSAGVEPVQILDGFDNYTYRKHEAADLLPAPGEEGDG